MEIIQAPPPEERLGPDDRFNFACDRSLACFNSCCRGKRLPLTPYDVLRLKQGLGLHSDEFLARYALYVRDPATGFPHIVLKMGEDEQRRCPFVGREGCTVYEDRTPRCLGRERRESWTVREWCGNQGLSPYFEMNDRMLDLVFHPAGEGAPPLGPGQLQKVMVALYNVDVFREFVRTPAFQDRFGAEMQGTARAIRQDEALLDLGFEFLNRTLFEGEGSR
ncbi:MAG: YkgJ family cysteine cluster protein [Deltaproteobacteria bacterium]|nr:YkgJ family cysteine cluster protein [Deltaproteobacteria bacterium]